jgi:hypothetical protein
VPNLNVLYVVQETIEIVYECQILALNNFLFFVAGGVGVEECILWLGFAKQKQDRKS